jgi:hypothetical protein
MVKDIKRRQARKGHSLAREVEVRASKDMKRSKLARRTHLLEMAEMKTG